MRHWKKGALMISLCLLLSGCGGGETEPQDTAEEIRAAYAGMTAFTAEAEITADYGERVYTYTVSLAGSLEEGSLTVTGPDTVAGTSVRWTEEGRTLVYEDVSLETGTLSPDGLSPADAMPLILRTAVQGEVLECASEALDDRACVRLTCANPEPGQEESELVFWFSSEDFSLVRAEVCWSGTTVIIMEYTQFQFT